MKRIKPSIKHIRESFPDVTWIYDKKTGHYLGNDGSIIKACCHMSLSEGGVETYTTCWYRYFSDANQMAEWVF
jgi:hypothetical protein